MKREINLQESNRAEAFRMWMSSPMPMVTLVKTLDVSRLVKVSKKTFTYVIGGIYKGGDVPEGMQLFPIHSGKWLKMHFEGGMKAFQEQYEKFHKEWLPAHPEYKWTPNS